VKDGASRVEQTLVSSVAKLEEEFPFIVEDLDAMVVPICDDDAICVVDVDPTWTIELTWAITFCTKLTDKPV